MEQKILDSIPQLSLKVVKSKKVKFNDLIKLSSSSECYEVVKILFNQDTFVIQEEFILLLLNRANRLLGFHRLSIGGMTGTVVDPKLVCLAALNTVGCSGVILAHNHPSGNKEPSESDKKITDKIKYGLQFLDINLIDHLILTEEEYFSFADEGII